MKREVDEDCAYTGRSRQRHSVQLLFVIKSLYLASIKKTSDVECFNVFERCIFWIILPVVTYRVRPGIAH
jgi:hypothetical protein